MLGQWELCCLGSWTLVLLSTTASAQSIGGMEMFSQASSRPAGNSLTLQSNPATLDYATFVLELLAFVAKEVLPDSEDEFLESRIGSRLSDSMPERRSEFGSHCLTIVAQLRDAVPYLSTDGASSAFPLDDRPRASATLALRRMWSAFENGAGDDRGGVSLNFKVGTNKVGMGLTFQW